MLKQTINETEEQKQIRLKGNKILKKAVEFLNNGYDTNILLKETPLELRKNQEYVLMLIEANPYIYRILTLEERNNALIINTAVKARPGFIASLDYCYIHKIDPEIAKNAVLKSPLMYEKVKSLIEGDQTYFETLVSLNLSVVTDIPQENVDRMNYLIFAKGLRANPTAVNIIESVPPQIVNSEEFLLEIEDILEERKNSVFLPEYGMLYEKLTAIYRERNLHKKINEMDNQKEFHIKRKI